MELNTIPTHEEARAAVATLQAYCHGHMAHWWVNPHTGADIRENPLQFQSKLVLVHSELSEALEGDRKSQNDDHLPHRAMREVELADALIRLFDMGGGFSLDLAGALVEKMAYNLQRADHKLDARRAEGGKLY